MFAIQVMATEGPLLVGSILDPHGQGWPCREWACKQASRDPMSEDWLFLRAFFTFISFPPNLLDVDEMSLNFLPRTYVEGTREQFCIILGSSKICLLRAAYIHEMKILFCSTQLRLIQKYRNFFEQLNIFECQANLRSIKYMKLNETLIEYVSNISNKK